MNRNEILRRKRNSYFEAVDAMVRDLYKQGYIIIARPLCRGYKGVRTEFGYYDTYKKQSVYIIELANRCPYYLNRSKSNNYYTRIIFQKAQTEEDLYPL